MDALHHENLMADSDCAQSSALTMTMTSNQSNIDQEMSSNTSSGDEEEEQEQEQEQDEELISFEDSCDESKGMDSSQDLYQFLPSMGRMPPDGDEFPNRWSENNKSIDSNPNMSSSSASSYGSKKVFRSELKMNSDDVPPPLPSTGPPLLTRRSSSVEDKKRIFIAQATNGTTNSNNNNNSNSNMSPSPMSHQRSSAHQEPSKKSVRDKIALFSSRSSSIEETTTDSTGSGYSTLPNGSSMRNISSSTITATATTTSSLPRSAASSAFSKSSDNLLHGMNVSLSTASSGVGGGVGKPSGEKWKNGISQSTFDLSTSSSNNNNTNYHSRKNSVESAKIQGGGKSSTGLNNNGTDAQNFYNSTPSKSMMMMNDRSQRSQSMLDVGLENDQVSSSYQRVSSSSSSSNNNNNNNTYRYNSLTPKTDVHQLTSASIMESRRKANLSKLRGLVIPDKTPVMTTSVVDLPTIISKDATATSTATLPTSSLMNLNKSSLGLGLGPDYKTNHKTSTLPPQYKPRQTVSRTESFDSYKNDNNSAKTLVSGSAASAETDITDWKLPSALPKYSPAFKRRSLTPYQSSLSSSNNIITPATATPTPTATITTPQKTLPMHFSTPEPKSLESLTSPHSDSNFEFPESPIPIPSSRSTTTDSSSNLTPIPRNKTFGNTNNTPPPIIARKTTSSFTKNNEEQHQQQQQNITDDKNARVTPSNNNVNVSKYNNNNNNNNGKSKIDDSDNDSAVSSSRSSISHGLSPPNSPTPEESSSTPDPDPHHSSSTNNNNSNINQHHHHQAEGEDSSNSDEGWRVLKPQSVEAINRKNVLTSAKFSSGVGMGRPNGRGDDGEDADAEEDTESSCSELDVNSDQRRSSITTRLGQKMMVRRSSSSNNPTKNDTEEDDEDQEDHDQVDHNRDRERERVVTHQHQQQQLATPSSHSQQSSMDLNELILPELTESPLQAIFDMEVQMAYINEICDALPSRGDSISNRYFNRRDSEQTVIERPIIRERKLSSSSQHQHQQQQLQLQQDQIDSITDRRNRNRSSSGNESDFSSSISVASSQTQNNSQHQLISSSSTTTSSSISNNHSNDHHNYNNNNNTPPAMTTTTAAKVVGAVKISTTTTNKSPTSSGTINNNPQQGLDKSDDKWSMLEKKYSKSLTSVNLLGNQETSKLVESGSSLSVATTTNNNNSNSNKESIEKTIDRMMEKVSVLDGKAGGKSAGANMPKGRNDFKSLTSKWAQLSGDANSSSSSSNSNSNSNSKATTTTTMTTTIASSSPSSLSKPPLFEKPQMLATSTPLSSSSSYLRSSLETTKIEPQDYNTRSDVRNDVTSPSLQSSASPSGSTKTDEDELNLSELQELPERDPSSATSSWRESSEREKRSGERFLNSSASSGSEMILPMHSTKRSVSVNDIRKAFEKAEVAVNSSYGRDDNCTMKTGNKDVNDLSLPSTHFRVSSFDSTTSEESSATTPAGLYGSVNSLVSSAQVSSRMGDRDPYGSITSLASSTSLISPQELQQLIDEANQSLEEAGTPSHEVCVIILHREYAGGSLGITLAGGADYETKEITVHKVLTGSIADRDGRVHRGDRVLSINGKSTKNLTHREALNLLKAPRTEVVLVVSRGRTGSNGFQTIEETSVTLDRTAGRSEGSLSSLLENDEEGGIKWGPIKSVMMIKEGAGLGFSLEGGKGSIQGDKPLTVKKIFVGGPAEKCGTLTVGDLIVSINNVNMSLKSRTEAWNFMKKLGDGEVKINVRTPI